MNHWYAAEKLIEQKQQEIDIVQQKYWQLADANKKTRYNLLSILLPAISIIVQKDNGKTVLNVKVTIKHG